MGIHQKEIQQLEGELANLEAIRRNDGIEVTTHRLSEIGNRLQWLRQAERDSAAETRRASSVAEVASVRPEHLPAFRSMLVAELRDLPPGSAARASEIDAAIEAVDQRLATPPPLAQELAQSGARFSPTPDQRIAARRTYEALRRANPIEASRYAESRPYIFDGAA